MPFGSDARFLYSWLAFVYSDSEKEFRFDFSQDNPNKPISETMKLFTNLNVQKLIDNGLFRFNNGAYGGHQNDFGNELDKTGMMILPSGWKNKLPNQLINDDVTLAPVPVGPSGITSVPTFSTSSFVVSSNGKHSKEAWEFHNWLNAQQPGKETSVLGDWLIMQNLIPTKKSDLEAADKVSDVVQREYILLLKEARGLSAEDWNPEKLEQVSKTIQKLVSGET